MHLVAQPVSYGQSVAAMGGATDAGSDRLAALLGREQDRSAAIEHGRFDRVAVRAVDHAVGAPEHHEVEGPRAARDEFGRIARLLAPVGRGLVRPARGGGGTRRHAAPVAYPHATATSAKRTPPDSGAWPPVESPAQARREVGGDDGSIAR